MKLRGAVVGVGYLGNFHAQKYRALSSGTFQDKIEFVGVCDLNLAQAQKVAGELSVQAFSKPQDLVGKVDFVSIATVTSSHYEMAKLFLQNGIHVNVEKPMTVKVSEAQELLALAKSKGLVLCVGHSERFNPAYRALKEIVQKPVHMDLQRHASFKSRGSDVSVVHDLMIHDLDLAISMDPSACKITRAVGGVMMTKTLDWADCGLKFASGATAHISVSRMAPQMTRAMKVFDAERAYEANLQTGDLAVMTPSKTELGFVVEQKNCGKGDNLLLETEAFFRAVLGEAAPIITGEHGLEALRLVEEVVSSILQK
jgi:predicted dehydrogenase